jgi:hypothetical protein
MPVNLFCRSAAVPAVLLHAARGNQIPSGQSKLDSGEMRGRANRFRNVPVTDFLILRFRKINQARCSAFNSITFGGSSRVIRAAIRCE